MWYDKEYDFLKVDATMLTHSVHSICTPQPSPKGAQHIINSPCAEGGRGMLRHRWPQ